MMNKPTATTDRKLRDQLIAMLEAGLTNDQINTFWVIQQYEHEKISHRKVFELSMLLWADDPFYSLERTRDDINKLITADFISVEIDKDPNGNGFAYIIIVSDFMRGI